MKIAFQPILNLEVWHDYYLGPTDGLDTLPAKYDISAAIALMPTLECQRTLRNLRWLMRPQPYGAILLAQVDTHTDSPAEAASLKPIVSIDPDTTLTFWLVVGDRTFANYTNLPLASPRQQIYYFSNQSGNQASNALFLSQPLKAYASGTEYPLGHLVAYKNRQGAMTLEAARYQASASRTPKLIKPVDLNGDAPDTGPPSRARRRLGEWLKLPSSQYVSTKDHLPRQGLSRTQTIPRASPGETFQFSLVNLNEKETFSQKILVPAGHPTGVALPVNLNFSGQAPGYYHLRLNGATIDEFVFFDPMAGRNAFALIEISLNPGTVPSPFQLVESGDETLQLHPKTYRIRFKNRATRWRYHCDRPHGFTADSLPTNLQLIDDRTYATQYPIGLYRQPKRHLTDGNDQPLPTPNVAMINPLIESAADGSRQIMTIFSDIYL
ncbi:MAG: hypothetical protein F6K19_06080 [Cyanothece sp. SIO1E1]|nr:hypothetical protein [Cyanothece sp. SIO1E1]